MKNDAAIWRSVFALATHRPPEHPPPAFAWTPAHLTLEEVLERKLDPTTWIGSAWADLFAKLASARAVIARTTAEPVAGEL
eukprot:8937746-Pyramimonas_sp.AAC.1